MGMSLLERLLFALVSEGVDANGLRGRFLAILDEYNISPKETALSVYSEGKNEMLLKRFILAKTVAGLSKKTIYQYYRIIWKVLTAIGKDVDAIRTEDFQVYFAKRISAGVSKSFADTERRYLNSFYSWLLREELITKNPMARIDKIKFQKKKEPAFSDIEVEKLRGACRDSRESAVVELLMSTGCRVSELVSIKRMDIDDKVINILGKGGKYRNVYLNARAQVAIERYLAERKDCNPYMFPRGVSPAKDGGNRKMLIAKENWWKDVECIEPNGSLDKGSIETLLRKLGKRAGVENCHPHRFRRTCATMALTRGMPIELVSKMLGHAEIATTQIYLDISEDDLAQAHRKFVT